MGTQSGLRLFGVAVRDNARMESIASGTELIHHRGLGAIVEPASYSNSKLTDEELARYAAVIEEAFEAGPILPAPPGTLFKSHGTLSHWLELHYLTLTEAMNVVEGHVTGRVSIGAGAAVKEDDAAKSYKGLGAESLRLFRGQAAATVLLPVTEDETKEGVIARASFLVDAEKWEAFQKTVADESKRQRALDLRLTGPWPPYDFVRMQFGG